MSTEQRCGTCRYYAEWEHEEFGDCTWSDTHLPISIDIEFKRLVSRTDGEPCKTWQAKETDHG